MSQRGNSSDNYIIFGNENTLHENIKGRDKLTKSEILTLENFII